MIDWSYSKTAHGYRWALLIALMTTAFICNDVLAQDAASLTSTHQPADDIFVAPTEHVNIADIPAKQ